jgi:hypothetical protein
MRRIYGAAHLRCSASAVQRIYGAAAIFFSFFNLLLINEREIVEK